MNLGKVCPKCKIYKDSSLFNRNKCKSDNMSTQCKSCLKENYNKSKDKYLKQKRNHYSNNENYYKLKNRNQYMKHLVKKMYDSAKSRAKKKNLPFDISHSDIIIPEYCPVLGIKLEPQVGIVKNCSPSLDKIIPSLGYVRGNIIVVSLRANLVKNDASIEELEKVYLFYKGVLS